MAKMAAPKRWSHGNEGRTACNTLGVDVGVEWVAVGLVAGGEVVKSTMEGMGRESAVERMRREGEGEQLGFSFSFFFFFFLSFS